MGWGTSPATIQSSLKTAVISTRKGGRLEEGESFARGLVRIRATLMRFAQPMRRAESSCQCRLHLNISARGLSSGRSTKAK